MGALHSLPLPRYGCCIRPQNPNRCKENHSRMPKGKGGHRRNLSAAFSFPEADNSCGNDLLNINTATEEELMTLPGINRQTAQNIVEYRRQIDGFRKVEDLALVSGVGATRLNHIRLELCVGRRGLSKNSSASSSGIDISMHDNVSRGSAAGQARGVMKVNVNTSNVFQLMKVRFISQNLAENIVAYRDRKGPFASFDELLKVKGLRPEVLSAVQPFLLLEGDTSSTFADAALPLSAAPLDLKFSDRSSPELHPLGPFARRSVRNSVACTGSENCVRVASWNLDSCSLEKMENPGVREVVAMTILENRFGIVAVQDITSPQSLQKLMDELSCPTLTNVKSWQGPRGSWNYIVSPPFSTTSQAVSHLAFLYDVEKEVELTNSGFACSVSSSNDQLSVPLFLAEFKVRSLELTITNTYLEPPKTSDSRLAEHLVAPVASLMTQYENQGTRNLLLAGHFGISPESPAMMSLTSADFYPVLSAGNFTDISLKNTVGSICSENMWISQELVKARTGKSEVIRSGLTSPWIPHGQWGWGGMVSTYCPFVTEFRIDGSRDAQESLEDHRGSCASFVENS